MPRRRGSPESAMPERMPARRSKTRTKTRRLPDDLIMGTSLVKRAWRARTVPGRAMASYGRDTGCQTKPETLQLPYHWKISARKHRFQVSAWTGYTHNPGIRQVITYFPLWRWRKRGGEIAGAESLRRRDRKMPAGREETRLRRQLLLQQFVHLRRVC